MEGAIMFLKNYTLEIFKSHCDPGAKGVHCYAHLDNDISEVLPYLNTELGGFIYTEDPPTLTLKIYGKLITIHSHKFAINALIDEEEADKIANWLQREINATWERREEIIPSTRSSEQPQLMEIFKLLPRTNCKECEQPTCLVFASLVVEGVKDHTDCPPMIEDDHNKLKDYLSKFTFFE
jgi:ArsR family metal-binding transcriptional regulator